MFGTEIHGDFTFVMITCRVLIPTEKGKEKYIYLYSDVVTVRPYGPVHTRGHESNHIWKYDTATLHWDRISQKYTHSLFLA